MPYTITHLQTYNLIEKVYTGKLTPPELLEIVIKTDEMMRATGAIKVLADCTHMTEGYTAFDLYYLMEKITEMGIDPHSTEAIILSTNEDTTKNLLFFETIAANNGFKCKTFLNRESAMEWLLSH